MIKMIKLGLAYADDTPSEEMKKERDEAIESKYRNASVEDNLARFELLLEGLHHREEKKVKKEEKKQEAT